VCRIQDQGSGSEAHATYQVHLLPAKRFPSSPAVGVAACPDVAWHLQCTGPVLRGEESAFEEAKSSPEELLKHVSR
jgi:hypothetical protein